MAKNVTKQITEIDDKKFMPHLKKLCEEIRITTIINRYLLLTLISPFFYQMIIVAQNTRRVVVLCSEFRKPPKEYTTPLAV